MIEFLIITTIIFLSVFSLVLAAVVVFKNDLKNIYYYRFFKDKKINCQRCATCCRYTVLVSKEDIERFKAANIPVNSVTQQIFPFIRILKKEKNHCIFFEETFDKNENKILSSCSIHEHRPDACRRFPIINYGFVNGIDCRCNFVKTEIARKKSLNNDKS